MCFSPEASFAAGVALLPAGGYCVRQALAKQRSYLGFAAIPLFFGIQQLCEGFVWLGVGRGEEGLIRTASIGFLFFALAWWPFWIPLATLMVESQPGRKRLIAAVTCLSLTWGLVLFYPVASDPERWLTTRAVHHSIQYGYPDLPVYRIVPQTWLRLLYFATIAVPLAVCSHRKGGAFGGLLVVSVVVSQWFYWYAFVSVWCFFAALLSLLLCYFFATEGKVGEEAPPSGPSLRPVGGNER
jgi:hypothetical protein